MSKSAQPQNIERELVREVSFSICGDWLTDHLRDRVLSADWRRAYAILLEDVTGVTHEIAVSILKGEKRFTGNSASEDGISLVDEDQTNDEVVRYLDTLKFQYCGLLNVNGKSYRPSWKIEALNTQDYEFAAKVHGRSFADSQEFLAERARFFAGVENVGYHVTVPRTPIGDRHRVDLRKSDDASEWLVVWEPCDDYPIWLKPHTDPAAALSEYLERRHISKTGADTEMLDMIEQRPEEYEVYLRADRNLDWEDYDARDALLARDHQEHVDELRKAILEQAGPKDGEGWLRLPIYNNAYDGHHPKGEPDRYLDVPKLPFLHWALGYTNPEDFGVVGPWKCISSSGMKMLNDSAYHSDWVIGAGFDPESFYKQKDVEDSSNLYRVGACQDLMNFDFAVLSKGSKDYYSGKIKLLQPGDSLAKGQIGVIPHAGVEFDSALQSAAKYGCAIITITGGRLAHMATVGREMNVPIIMWDKAGSLRPHMDVSIRMDTGKIHIQAV